MLKEIRERKKMTQTQLAFLSGISIKTISRLETGDKNVNLQTIEKLAEFLEVNIEEIIEIKKR